MRRLLDSDPLTPEGGDPLVTDDIEYNAPDDIDADNPE
jgi:hypothetical protein